MPTVFWLERVGPDTVVEIESAFETITAEYYQHIREAICFGPNGREFCPAAEPGRIATAIFTSLTAEDASLCVASLR